MSVATMYGEPITVGTTVFSIVSLTDDWTPPKALRVTAVHEDSGTVEAGGRFYDQRDVLLADDGGHHHHYAVIVQQPKPLALAIPKEPLRHDLASVLEDEDVELTELPKCNCLDNFSSYLCPLHR